MSKSETQTSKDNGEDGCCLLVKRIVSLLRVQENSRLITVPHYLTSLSLSYFSGKLVRFVLSGLVICYCLGLPRMQPFRNAGKDILFL